MRWVEDWPIVAGCVAGMAVIGVLVYVLYWDYQHPCTRYQAVWQEAWTELSSYSCGPKGRATCMTTTYHAAHWVQQCVERGDRSLGAVEAPAAVIPVEAPE